jgi:hypothetical protein
MGIVVADESRQGRRDPPASRRARHGAPLLPMDAKRGGETARVPLDEALPAARGRGTDILAHRRGAAVVVHD